MKRWTSLTKAAAVFLTTALSMARGAVSSTTHVGALEYIEGSAFVNGKAVRGNQEKLPILDDGALLRTEKGHAEMLLTPGVFLRLDAGSEIRLASASLTDTRVQLNHGAAMLEVDDLHKDNLLRVQVGADTVKVLKTGLYRFQAEPANVHVLIGRIETVEGDRNLKVGKHHEVSSPGLIVTKFKSAPEDDLSRWSRLRSEYEADASVASAQYVYDLGMPWGFSDWFWNPWFSTWTWLPTSGFWMNPYGFGYWSPFMVYDYFPARYYGSRHYIYTSRAGRLSPSGLNLQRGPQVRAARNEMIAGRQFSSRAGAVGMQARSRGTGTGGAMGSRSFPMASHSAGGGFHGGRR